MKKTIKLTIKGMMILLAPLLFGYMVMLVLLLIRS